MKTLRKLCLAVVLIQALTLPVFSGQITTMSAPPPPSTTPTTTEGQVSTGVASTSDATGSEDGAVASVMELVLHLLQGVLSVF